VRLRDCARNAQWQSAGAIGINARGFLIWGGGYYWERPTYAEEAAPALRKFTGRLLQGRA